MAALFVLLNKNIADGGLSLSDFFVRFLSTTQAV
jgi:hypothetical protein